MGKGNGTTRYKGSNNTQMSSASATAQTSSLSSSEREELRKKYHFTDSISDEVLLSKGLAKIYDSDYKEQAVEAYNAMEQSDKGYKYKDHVMDNVHGWLPSFVDYMKKTGGAEIVVDHSGTTPSVTMNGRQLDRKDVFKLVGKKYDRKMGNGDYGLMLSQFVVQKSKSKKWVKSATQKW